jgi:lactam utilization protein B
VRLATEGIMLGARRVSVDTLCIHGDGPHAVEFAQAVRAALQAHAFELQPL